MLRILSILLLLAVPGCVLSSAEKALAESGSVIPWSCVYQGEREVRSITPLPGGGHILAGWIHKGEKRKRDLFIGRIDREGSMEWEKSYGGSENDEASGVALMNDGSCLLAGTTESFGEGKKDLWIVRVSKKGDMLWQKSCGGREDDEGKALIAMGGDRYAILAQTQSFGAGNRDAWLLAIRGNGALLWQNAVGGFGNDELHCLARSTEGTLVAGGMTESFGDKRSKISITDKKTGKHLRTVSYYETGWIFALDVKGSLKWQKAYSRLSASACVPEKDGGMLVAGSGALMPDSQESAALLMRIDRKGGILWQRVFYGTKSNCFSALAKTEEGGYLAAGWTYLSHTYWDEAWLASFNRDCTIRWQECAGRGEMNRATAVAPAPRGFIAALLFAKKGYQGMYFVPEEPTLSIFRGAGNSPLSSAPPEKARIHTPRLRSSLYTHTTITDSWARTYRTSAIARDSSAAEAH